MNLSDSPGNSERVLILAATPEEAETTAKDFREMNLDPVICESLDTFCREADLGAGVGVIAEVRLTDQWQPTLKRWTESQPTWSDLPLLVLSCQEDCLPVVESLRRNANVTVINRPGHIQSLVAAVQSRLRDRNRQYMIRDLLNSLRESEKMIREQADAMPNIVFASDADGRIDYVNRSGVDFIGTSDMHLFGDGWLAAVHPEDRDRTVARWQNSVTSGKDYQIEFRIRRASTGKYRWHIARGVPSRDEHGNIVRWFGTCTDIHEQKLIQRRLNEAVEQAASANVAKSEFIANMSHEIRTPMTAVLGYVELLKHKETDPEKLGFLRTIDRNGRFLLEIINDILDLSKIEADKLDLQPQRFQPHQLVYDVQSMMHVRAVEKQLEFPVKFHGKIPEFIDSDPKRLRQILVNLIGNAIKFTDDGSVQLLTRYEHGSLWFDVVDTGIGMTPDQIDRLFQPFTQGDASVDRKFGGTGLGLAISQRLAGMLGGEITVSSEPGIGTRFSCRIDAGAVEGTHFIDPPRNHVVEDTAKHADFPTLDCRVLVVDDRRDVRFLAGHFLKRSGAEVVFAEDGVEATEIVQSSMAEGLPFNLVLMDMQMPRMDGYRAAATLREMGFKNPIVALTADAMQGDMDRCIASGCNAYLSKPIDARELVRVVDLFT